MAAANNKSTQQGMNSNQQTCLPSGHTVNQASHANHANQSYTLPPVYQYPQPFMSMNPISPVYSQSSPHFGQTTQGNGDPLQTILSRLEILDSRLENMNSKLSQLEQITQKVNSIKSRLDSLDKKLGELEASQNFICDKYDVMSTSVTDTSKKVKILESKISELQSEKMKSEQDKLSLKEDIIDLKCRSMRVNMIFFGLTEPTGSIHDMPGESNANKPASSTTNRNIENCEEKVLDFCEKVLKITNPRESISIDRAHRMGGKIANKTRPVVVKFKDTNSKMRVKDALKTVNLRGSQYNVSEQFPPEVQARRKELFPVLTEARNKGSRAVLVRDKIYIDNKLYVAKDTSNRD